MGAYQKPDLMIEENCAEGVFMASGDGGDVQWYKHESSSAKSYGWEIRWGFRIPASSVDKYQGKTVKISVKFAGVVHKAWGNGEGSVNLNETRNTDTLTYTIDNFDCNASTNYLTVQAVTDEGQSEASCNLVSKSLEIVS